MRKRYFVIVDGRRVLTLYTPRNEGDIINSKRFFARLCVLKVDGDRLYCIWTKCDT
ncbi:MAG: hypothetical protein ACYDG2_03760 [Ruminiclostridium sp.]